MKLNLTPIRHQKGQKSNKRTTSQEQLENFLQDNYNIHINVLDGKFYEKKGSNMVEMNELNILRSCRLNDIASSKQRIIETLLADNFCPQFNPIKHYFDNLPEWNGEKDYILQLASYVKLSYEAKDRERFNLHFKKMFVRAVACSLNNEINKHAVVFIGGQHKGKTSFCEFLCPKQLDKYMETILPGQTIEPETTALKFWAVMDEMGKFTPRQLETNKAIMVLSQVFIRFFDKYKRQMKRHCNFIATTNYTEIFNDETGNSRFLPFEIHDIDWKGYIKDVNIDHCWSQALKIYQLSNSGELDFKYDLDTSDILLNDEICTMYIIQTPVSRLIRKYFIKPSQSNLHEAQFMSATEILEYLVKTNEYRHEDKTKFTEQKVGTAMSMLKFPKSQKWINEKGYPMKGYYVLIDNNK